MSLKSRTVVFAAMVGVTIMCCLFFSKGTTNPKAGVVVWLPAEISDHRGEEGFMGLAEKKWLPSDTTFLKMSYFDRGLPQQIAQFRAIHATLIVAGADSRSLHRPQVCLTAQGWTIAKREIVTLDTAGGPLEVMDYHLTQFIRNEDGSLRLDAKGDKIPLRAHYVYWWIGPSHTTASDEEKVWSSVWGSILKGENERWAYPSVMVLVDDRAGPEEGQKDAQKRVFDFIKKHAPSFQISLGAKDREGARPLSTF